MRKGFTFLELVFVIVVIGILANFGTNILLTSYTNFTASTVNNKMLADTELTLKQIANRLQYRIKDSVVASVPAVQTPLHSVAAGANLNVLEWIGYDIDGWLGSPGTLPTWSGFIDVNDANAITSNQVPLPPAAPAGNRTYLESPGTNSASVNAVITALRANGSGTTMANAAIFFTGANSDPIGGYWAQQDYQVLASAHPISDTNISATRLVDATIIPAVTPDLQAGLNVGDPSTFGNTDVYENYLLAWTAYAAAWEDSDGDGVEDELALYYDYQPWAGETYIADGTRVLLAENVSNFRFAGVGETVMVAVCISDNNALGAGDGGYSVCEVISIF